MSHTLHWAFVVLTVVTVWFVVALAVGLVLGSFIRRAGALALAREPVTLTAPTARVRAPADNSLNASNATNGRKPTAAAVRRFPPSRSTTPVAVAARLTQPR